MKFLNTKFPFNNKDEARRLFNEMRQMFIDWNYTAWNSNSFKEIESSIDSKEGKPKSRLG